MPRFKRREAGTFTVVYYDHKGGVVLTETLRAHGMDEALYQASRTKPHGAVRHRVFDEELEAMQGAANISEALRRLSRIGQAAED